MKPRVLAVIPARLSARRFPSKVLFRYQGWPLLYYVWHETKKSSCIDQLVIATDNREIAREARQFGAEVVMTSRRHRTGSDRVAEVARQLGGQVVLNVQGDNLGLKHTVIDRLVTYMTARRSAEAGTLVSRIDSDEELFDPSCVKVIGTADRQALWFSRFPLPYLRTVTRGSRHRQFRFFKHIGVYAFRSDILARFSTTRQTALEKAEALEQLRLLEMGVIIKLLTTRARSVSVDKPDDIRKLSLSGF